MGSAIESAIESAAMKAGFDNVKQKQKEAIGEFVSGNDVFVSLPTEYGKSLCYVLLPLVFDLLLRRKGSIVLCISPLTSLMMEQRDKYSKLGLPCEYVGHLQQDLESMNNIQKGEVQLPYTSPESILCNPQWRELLHLQVYRDKMVGLIIDESHCIAMW